jgi:hypothetical protein
MIKLIIKLNAPITQDTSELKRAERAALFRKYKSQGKIVSDFIIVNDITIELRFNTLESAQAFEQEATAMYAKYDDSAIFEYE